MLCFFCGVLMTLAIGMMLVWQQTVEKNAEGTLTASTLAFLSVVAVCTAVVINSMGISKDTRDRERNNALEEKKLEGRR